MAIDEKALAHAWNYFALHANQRIAVFNYFVIFAGVLSTGIAAAIQAPPRLAFVGVALGILLAVLSLVFWKLDQRASFFVKHAESIIKQLEPNNALLVTEEERLTAAARQTTQMWTYGKSFRTIFLCMAIIGLIGALLSGLRAGGVLDWGTDINAPAAQP